LELFSVTALSLYLANARNDPNYEKTRSVLDYLRDSVSKMTYVSVGAKHAAEVYADGLIQEMAQGIRTMRGEGGQSH
jgi:hypothetical protein